MKKLKHSVVPNFSVEVLKQKYLECECPGEKTRWHIIWLLADTAHPQNPREVADWADNPLVRSGGFSHRYGFRSARGIELCYLLPYTPELQPAERLWPLLREAIANKVCPTLSALEEVLVNRCQWLSKNKEKVQALVDFSGYAKWKHNMNHANLV